MPIFYEITTPTGKKNYLFGTLHLSNEEINRLPLEVKSAFEAASELYVEFDGPLDVITAQSRKIWFTRFGTAHNQWIHTPGKVADVVQRLTERFPSATNLELLVCSTPPLSVLFFVQKQYRGENILDHNLIRMAKKRGRIVHNLDDNASLIPVFSHSAFTFKEQWQLFDIFMKAYQRGHGSFDKIVNDYLDDKVLDVEDNINIYEEAERPLVRRYYTEFIMKRDKIMADKLKIPFLIGNAFVAVGAMHLNGIVSLYQQQGYTIKSIPITERIYPVLDYYEKNESDIFYTAMSVILSIVVGGITALMINVPIIGVGLLCVAVVLTIYALVKATFLIHEYINQPIIQATEPLDISQSRLVRMSMFHKKLDSSATSGNQDHKHTILDKLNSCSPVLLLDVEAEENVNKILQYQGEYYQLDEAIHRIQSPISQETFDALLTFAGDPREFVRSTNAARP